MSKVTKRAIFHVHIIHVNIISESNTVRDLLKVFQIQMPTSWGFCRGKNYYFAFCNKIRRAFNATTVLISLYVSK